MGGRDGATAMQRPAGAFVSLSSFISWLFADDSKDSSLGDTRAT